MFSKRLELTSDQEEKLGAILEGYRGRFGNLRLHMHPLYTALRDSLNTDIRAILTPAQQEKFETMLHEFNERRRWKFDHGHGDGPPLREPE